MDLGKRGLRVAFRELYFYMDLIDQVFQALACLAFSDRLETVCRIAAQTTRGLSRS